MICVRHRGALGLSPIADGNADSQPGSDSQKKPYCGLVSNNTHCDSYRQANRNAESDKS
jgi:hypothetical protein